MQITGRSLRLPIESSDKASTRMKFHFYVYYCFLKNLCSFEVFYLDGYFSNCVLEQVLEILSYLISFLHPISGRLLFNKKVYQEIPFVNCWISIYLVDLRHSVDSELSCK